MKKFLYSFFAVLISISAFSQIPNPSFENWNSTTLTTPSGWQIAGKASQYTPAVNGSYAVKLERNILNPQEPGAVIYGQPDNNTVHGGIPFASRVDSIVGFFNWDVVLGDSAWILVVFKYQGSPISMDIFALTGTSAAGYTRKAFKINLPPLVIPDSLVIGVTSTNPNGSFQGSYVIADSLHFTGTTLTIPNGNFESWVSITDEEPALWNSTNNSMLSNPILPVTKTTDSYSGTYAIRLENLFFQGQYTKTYIMCGKQGNNGPLPGFPVTMRDSTLNGWYKYLPQSNDSLTIGVLMYQSGVQVGWGFLQSGIQKTNYTYFSVPIYYDGALVGNPDSAVVLATPFSTNTNIAHGNSILYLDNLSFDYVLNAPESIYTKNNLELNTYPNPVFEALKISYNLPEGGIVSIKLYDVTGREVMNIYNGNQAEGKYSLIYDAVGLSNGIYSLVIQTKNFKQTSKVVVQK